MTPSLGVLGGHAVHPAVRAHDGAAPLAGRGAERRADDGYSAVRYLVESLYDPNAYVVGGYDKGLMTPVHRPPIALSDDETASIVLYLLAKSGMDHDGPVLTEVRAEQRVFAALTGGDDTGPRPVAFSPGDAEDGKDAYAALRCMQCHETRGVRFDAEGAVPEGDVGPDLTSIGSIQTREYLIESMVSPNAVIVADPPGVERGDKRSYRNKGGGSKMPEFHDTITLRQLLDVADFLGALEGEAKNAELFR